MMKWSDAAAAVLAEHRDEKAKLLAGGREHIAWSKPDPHCTCGFRGGHDEVTAHVNTANARR